MSHNQRTLIPNVTSRDLPICRKINDKKLCYDTEYHPGYDVLLACNDVMEFLESVPEEIFSLIVTSPPYNLGKPYEKRLEFNKYLQWQKEIISALVRKLKPNGSICWQVGNFVKDKEVFPLDIFFYPLFTEQGMKLRNRIIWFFGHGLHARTRFSGRYETILWFTKTNDYTFNLDSVRVPQKYPGKKAYKGAKLGKYTGNPKGKNPSDIWQIVLRDWKAELWNIPNVKSNHPEKTIHPSQYPIELVERLVLALTDKGDIVFDPFLGVGTSCIAAFMHNRKGIGVDKESAYTDVAYDRLVEAMSGTLRKRPVEKSVHVPSKHTKITKKPREWDNA